MPPSRKPSRTPASSLLKELSLLLMLMPVSGCTTLTSFLDPQPTIIDTSCATFSTVVPDTGRPALPLKYHSTDAADTKAGARAVNRAYASLCPPSP